MKHLFSQIPRAQISRSVFDRSHGWKSTFDSGYLVPFLVDEVLPGDSYKVKFNFIARLSTPVVPTMDNLFLDTFYFFVPYRLLWKHWEQFNGQQDYPGASTDYLVPQTTAPADKGFDVGSLEDYFGLPTGIKGIKANELAARAYALIWNEWFRDENLQNPINLSTYAEISTADGLDDVGMGDRGFVGQHKLLRRCKRHDYFTSALPWPQKGPGVEIGLAGSAPISGTVPVNLYNLTGQVDGESPDAPYYSRLVGVDSTAGNWMNWQSSNRHSVIQSAGQGSLAFTGTADLSLTCLTMAPHTPKV